MGRQGCLLHCAPLVTAEDRDNRCPAKWTRVPHARGHSVPITQRNRSKYKSVVTGLPSWPRVLRLPDATGSVASRTDPGRGHMVC